jgi:hypothetical protein
MLTRFPDGALCGTALIGHRFVLRQRAVEPTPVDRTSANRNRLNDRFAQSREAAWGRLRSIVHPECRRSLQCLPSASTSVSVRPAAAVRAHVTLAIR